MSSEPARQAVPPSHPVSAPPPAPPAAEPEASGTRLRRLFKNTGIYAFGDASLQLLTALLAPLYTVLLAPEAFGVWGLGAMLLNGLAYIYNPALHGAVTRFFFDHEHDHAARRRFQGTIQAFLLGWSTLLTLALLAAGPWLFEHAFGEGLAFWPYGCLVLATAWFGIFGVVPRATWSAAESSKKLVGINFLTTGTNLTVALVLVAVVGIGVDGLFWARLAAVAATAVPFLLFARRHVGLAWDGPMLRSALVFSLPLVPHLLAHWILAMSDRYFIERMLGVGAVGVYTSAYVFIEAINLVATSMNRAWVPQFTRAYGDPAQAPFVARTVTYFVLAVIATCAALVVLSPTVVRLAFDARYHEAAVVAPILAVGGLFQGLYYIWVAVLFYHRRNGIVPIVTVAAGLLNVGLNLWWIPLWGLAGAAWATVVGYVLLAAGVWYASRSLGKVPMEGRRLLHLGVWGGVVMAVGVVIDGRLAPGWELAAKLGLVAVGAWALFATGFWTAEERGFWRAKGVRY